MGLLPDVTWFFLASQLAFAEHILSADVLADICGAQDLTLSPANPCFFRLFSMAQVRDECESYQDAKTCLASCFSDDYCDTLCKHAQSDKCSAQCRKLVICMQEDLELRHSASATRSCFEGQMSQSEEDDSFLEDWTSLAGLRAGVQDDIVVTKAAPTPAVAATPWAVPVSFHHVPPPVPMAPSPALRAAPAPSPQEAVAPSPFSAEVVLTTTAAPAMTVGTKAEVAIPTAPVVPTTTLVPVAVVPVARMAPPTAVREAASRTDADSCLCSLSGVVGGTSTGRQGCAVHGRESKVAKDAHYCFLDGPCKDADFQARPSEEFPGLHFRECNAVDNIRVLFPKGCRAGKPAKKAELHSTKTALSKLRGLSNVTAAEGPVESSKALRDAKRLTRALDALRGAGEQDRTISLAKDKFSPTAAPRSRRRKDDSWSSWFGFEGASLLHKTMRSSLRQHG